MSEERVRPDWEAIEKEYRAGQLSVAEIARQNNVSHPAILKKAKKEGWVRNLAEQVREAVTAKLVTDEVTAPNAREEEIIDAAAARGVEVVRSHRRDISTLKLTIDVLQIKTFHLSNNVADLKDLDIATGAVESLSRSLSRLIPLERQAFNLDDDAEKPKDQESEGRKSIRRLSYEQLCVFEELLSKTPNDSGSVGGSESGEGKL